MSKEPDRSSRQPGIKSVLGKLEKHIGGINMDYYDPFAQPSGIKGEWDYFNKRVNLRESEGYFGPVATMDRSRVVEEKMTDSVDRIIGIRADWHEGFTAGNYTEITKRIKILSREAIKNKPSEKDEIERQITAFEKAHDVATKKNIGLKLLMDFSEALNQGGETELAWSEMAVGLTSAYFEYYQENAQPPMSVELRNNQLSYMLLLTLNQGKYEFGDLETQARGVELPTGEGKTFAFNLAAGIMVLRGQNVHIIEPHYISAKDHAEQMGGFYLDFLGIETGVAIDVPEKSGYTTTTVVKKSGEVETITGKKSGRQSFIYGRFPKKTEIITSAPVLEGRLQQVELAQGRQTTWSKQIVFCDKNSVAFDYLESQEFGPLGTKTRYGLPELKQITAMVAEAERTMIKDGDHPWAISRKIDVPEKVWDRALELCGLNDKNLGKLIRVKGEPTQQALKNLSPQDKREYAQFVLFNLWSVLETNKDKFVEGEGHDFYYASGKLIVSVDAIETATKLLDHALHRQFPNPHTRANWLQHNYGLIQTALQVYLGMKPHRDSVMSQGVAKPVLIDRSGLPLEKHQFEPLTQLFFVMQNNWDEWQKKALAKLPEEQADPIEVLRTIIIDNRDKFELSMQTNRIYPHELFIKYGNLRYSSGTLLSSAGSFYKLFGAETLRISRHSTIAEPDMSMTGQASLWVGCPDGGFAQVQFNPDFLFLQQVRYRTNYLRANHRAGLIVCSDIEEARELKAMMPEKETVLVTAEEELKERGRLAKEVGNMQAGKIVITTEMAARDIDLKNSPEVIAAGGPEVIGIGIPSDENTMWQLLQRTVRGDQPGSRLLMIREGHIRPIKDRGLISGGSETIHRMQKSRIEQLWSRMFGGDKKAKTELFQEIIKHLRQEDEAHVDRLQQLVIRDQNLETWRSYLEKQWQEYDKTYDEMAELWSNVLQDITKNFYSFSIGFQATNAGVASKSEYQERFNAAWKVFMSQEILKYANLQ